MVEDWNAKKLTDNSGHVWMLGGRWGFYAYLSGIALYHSQYQIRMAKSHRFTHSHQLQPYGSASFQRDWVGTKNKGQMATELLSNPSRYSLIKKEWVFKQKGRDSETFWYLWRPWHPPSPPDYLKLRTRTLNSKSMCGNIIASRYDSRLSRKQHWSGKSP